MDFGPRAHENKLGYAVGASCRWSLSCADPADAPLIEFVMFQTESEDKRGRYDTAFALCFHCLRG